MGLDPGSPGSRPGPKAGAKPLSHLGCPDRPDLSEGASTAHTFSLLGSVASGMEIGHRAAWPARQGTRLGAGLDTRTPVRAPGHKHHSCTRGPRDCSRPSSGTSGARGAPHLEVCDPCQQPAEDRRTLLKPLHSRWWFRWRERNKGEKLFCRVRCGYVTTLCGPKGCRSRHFR